jgi:nucleoside-diphosphate-sugar epimerase
MKGAPKLRILTTGGAGYIGAVLTPKLLAAGHRVTVLDALVFGDAPLASVKGKDDFRLVCGDLRDRELVSRVLQEGRFDAVIHLAAISNDPSSELDPELTREVNLDAVEFLMREAKRSGVSRLLYASSASVYGIKEEEEVTEDLDLEPITIYARYKAEGEKILNGLVDEEFSGVSVRAATVCGYSPRMRFDLTINILTEHAVTKGRIRVFGGRQQRPNIHIRDLTDFYQRLLDAPADLIRGEAFNVSYSNASVGELAEMIRSEVDPELPIEVVPTDDQRSYRLSTGKLRGVLGFVPPTSLKDAVGEVAAALRDGRIAEPDAPLYRNVEWLKARPELLRAFAR